MTKYSLIILALAGLSACTSPTEQGDQPVEAVNTVSDSLLIRPGESVGNIKLGEDMQSLAKLSGTPDESDAAMGAASYTWFAKHDAAGYRTSIYGHRNFGGTDENVLHIKKILITSPDYKTADGLNTGTSRKGLSGFYHLNDSSRYVVKGKAFHVFADIKKGIAFEIDSLTNKCTAISVFRPGDTASVYINMY